MLKHILTPLAIFALASPTFSQTAPAPEPSPAQLWKDIQPHFSPPKEFTDLGPYRSPLEFDDGTKVKTPADWQRRRKEIFEDWTAAMGKWPKLLEKPRFDIDKTERRENFTQHAITIEVDAGKLQKGYFLVPDGPGPFPAVLIVYYEPETAIGKTNQKNADYALQLARRGIASLAIGQVEGGAGNPKVPYPDLQPLSYLAYVAANCHTALAQRKEIDPARIGVTGHSFAGKWAMFASCLYDKFAAAAWSDANIVFNPERQFADYWEPWYLGKEGDKKRTKGLITKDNPAMGAYKKLLDNHHDLTELHALMAPRPFLVSGGSQDQFSCWTALNHTAQVNKLLGFTNRIAFTSRPQHGPTPESARQLCDFFVHFLKNKNP